MKGNTEDLRAAVLGSILGAGWSVALYEPSEGDHPDTLPRLVASTPAARVRLILGPTRELERPCLIAFRRGAGIYVEVSEGAWAELQGLAASSSWDAPSRAREILAAWVRRGAFDAQTLAAQAEAALDALGPFGLGGEP